MYPVGKERMEPLGEALPRGRASREQPALRGALVKQLPPLAVLPGHVPWPCEVDERGSITFPAFPAGPQLPAGVIVFSTCMATACISVILESVKVRPWGCGMMWACEPARWRQRTRARSPSLKHRSPDLPGPLPFFSACQALISPPQDEGLPTQQLWLISGATVFVVVMKLALFLFCRGNRNPAVRAFALDHLNDVLVNGVGLAGEGQGCG